MAGIADSRADVVADHQDGDALPVEPGDEVVHLRRGHRVQARHRLVEQQELLRGAQGPGQEHPLLLAAGELSVAAVGKLRNAHPRHVLRRQTLFLLAVEGPEAAAAQAAGQDDLPHGGGEVALHHGLLGQIADLVLHQSVAGLDAAAQGRLQAQQGLHQRALAGAVLSDDAQIVPRVDAEAEIPHNDAGIIAQGQILSGEQCHAAPSFA